MDAWYYEEKNRITQLENHDEYVVDLYGRLTDEGWEYASVRWCHFSPTILWVVKNGKMLVDNTFREES